MNLAQTARAAVATFLVRDFSQQSFARLIQTPVATIQGWEQFRRSPYCSSAHILLKLIIQNPDLMVSALVQLKLTQRLRVDVPLEVASEVVNAILRGDRTDEERRSAAFSIARKLLSTRKNSMAGVSQVIEGFGRCRVTTIVPSRIIEKG